MGDITVKEMIKSAKKNLDEVSVADVKKKLNSSKANIIDLRDTAELIENGVIPGSHHASRGHLEFFADPKCVYYKDCFNKEKEIILFCNSGARSALAANTLKTMGYKNVSHMKGGFNAWMKEIGVIEAFS